MPLFEVPQLSNHNWPKHLLVIVLYGLVGIATQQYMMFTDSIMLIWPGSGLALAILLIGGKRYLISLFLAALSVNLMADPSLVNAFSRSLAELCQTALTYALLSFTPKLSFKTFSDHLRLIIKGSITCIIGGLIATLSQQYFQPASSIMLLEATLHWWMANLLGMILFTPFILVWHQYLNNHAKLSHLTLWQIAEHLFWYGSTLFAGQIIFLDFFNSHSLYIQGSYWPFLIITLVAIRLGVQGTTLISAILAIQATLSLSLQMSTLGQEVMHSLHYNYWAYLITLSMLGMTMATYTQTSKEAIQTMRLKDSALNAAANGIVITDKEGHIKWGNQAFTQLTGFTLAEVIDKNPREFLRSGLHDQSFYQKLWQTILDKQVWRGTMINRHKSGRLYDEDTTITPITDDEGEITHFIAVKQDITEQIENNKRIAYSESLFHGLFQHMSSGVAIYSPTDNGNNFIFKDFNAAAEQLDNVRRNDIVGKKLTDVFPGVIEFGLLDVLKRVYQNGIAEHFPITFYQDERISGWRENHLFRLSSGEVIAIYNDVTARKQMELALKESHKQIHSLLNSMAEGAYGIDTEGNCTFVNKAFLSMLGYDHPNEILGQYVHELIHHSHADGSHYPASKCTIYQATAHSEQVHRDDEVFWRKDGTPIQVEFWSEPVVLDGEKQGAIITFMDISERKKMQEEVRQLAFFDTLTKLPNRRLLNDRLQQVIAETKRNQSHAALIFLDLDNFKPINDLYGHEAGDKLLVEAANRLNYCMREMETVARFGGDEFLVLLSQLGKNQTTPQEQARIIAEKIRTTLSNPYQITLTLPDQSQQTIQHHCTASIGIMLFNGTEGTQEELVKWADSAMYAAKEAGRNQIRFYQPNKS